MEILDNVILEDRVNTRSESELLKQMSAELECVLPKLMQRLFTLEPNHPVSELPLAQLRVCTILQGGPLSMSVLSDELGISMSAMTQIADRLEKSVLVERSGEADDRRIKLLQLTKSGAKLMRDRREIRIEKVAAVLSEINPETRSEIIHSLRAMLHASDSVTVKSLVNDPVGSRQELS